MLSKDKLQKAISLAAEKGLNVVGTAAFEQTEKGWRPRVGCLLENYSSGEAVVCGILLCFYFEIYGQCSYVKVPPRRKINNSIADLVWPGAWFFVDASNKLSNSGSWDGIKSILPGNEL